MALGKHGACDWKGEHRASEVLFLDLDDGYVHVILTHQAVCLGFIYFLYVFDIVQ